MWQEVYGKSEWRFSTEDNCNSATLFQWQTSSLQEWARDGDVDNAVHPGALKIILIGFLSFTMEQADKLLGNNRSLHCQVTGLTRIKLNVRNEPGLLYG